jgi:hypothetical protein
MAVVALTVLDYILTRLAEIDGVSPYVHDVSATDRRVVGQYDVPPGDCPAVCVWLDSHAAPPGPTLGGRDHTVTYRLRAWAGTDTHDDDERHRSAWRMLSDLHRALTHGRDGDGQEVRSMGGVALDSELALVEVTSSPEDEDDGYPTVDGVLQVIYRTTDGGV